MLQMGHGRPFHRKNVLYTYFFPECGRFAREASGREKPAEVTPCWRGRQANALDHVTMQILFAGKAGTF